MSKKTTNVSVICNRLSQYIGDKRRNSATRIAPPRPPPTPAGVVSLSKRQPTMNLEEEEPQPVEAMVLFPLQSSSGDQRNHPPIDIDINKTQDHPPVDIDINKTEDDDINKIEASQKKGEGEVQKGHQLTMFYGGKVLVFDDVPVKKADDMISSMMVTKTETATATATVSTGDESHPNQNLGDRSQSMPIARRGSLHKFLEKRKERQDRINSKAPYQVITMMGGSEGEPSSSGSGSDPLWLLGLGHKNKDPKN